MYPTEILGNHAGFHLPTAENVRQIAVQAEPDPVTVLETTTSTTKLVDSPITLTVLRDGQVPTI